MLLTCIFSSRHFSSYPASSRSDVPSLCPVGPSTGTSTGWPIGQTTSMRTTGACPVGTSSAGSQRCLRSCKRAAVRPCCCTSCCTALTLTRQGNPVRLPSALLALASSSRSQRVMWPTTSLIPSDLPRTVRGRPLPSASFCGGCYSFSYSPVKVGAVVVAMGRGHQSRTGLARPDVVRRR